MENFEFSMLWYWVAYIIVTFIGMMHTTFNIYVLHMKPMDEHSMGEGYEKTKPYHMIYNILIFPIFALLYLNTLSSPTLYDALVTGLIWCGITVIFDAFAWVLIKHP